MSRSYYDDYEPGKEGHPSLIKKYSGDMTVETAESIIIAALFTSAVYAYDICHYDKVKGVFAGMLSQKHMVSKDAALSFSLLTLFFWMKGKHPMFYEFLDLMKSQRKKAGMEEFKITDKFVNSVRVLINFRRIINRKNILSACNFLRNHYEESFACKPFFFK